METEKVHPMSFKVVVLDETRYVRDEFKEKAGKLFGVYAYDASSVTHCCELTPSRDLRFLYYTTENHLSDDDHEIVLEMEGEDFYMWASDVDKLPHVQVSFQYDPEESQEENWDSFIEHYRGNCPF